MLIQLSYQSHVGQVLQLQLHLQPALQQSETNTIGVIFFSLGKGVNFCTFLTLGLKSTDSFFFESRLYPISIANGNIGSLIQIRVEGGGTVRIERHLNFDIQNFRSSEPQPTKALGFLRLVHT